MSKKLTVAAIEYPLDTQKTLLQNLEENSIAVEFQCRDGYCGACKCKLISGTVKYTTDPIAYLRDDEVLLCCAISEQDIHLDLN